MFAWNGLDTSSCSDCEEGSAGRADLLQLFCHSWFRAGGRGAQQHSAWKLGGWTELFLALAL